MSSGFGQELDASTLERAQRGDMAACARIYEIYGRTCYNLALRILGETAAAEDIVQSVFLKVMENVRGYRGEAPFGSWLKRLVVNATIDQVRANRRLGDTDADALLGVKPALASGADAHTDAWSLLMRLAPRARAILILHELEGYTHKELAAMFGQSESYSKSILARALHHLATLVEPSSPGGGAQLCAGGE
ncbi:MAG: RNA polymerase sigma factor [Rhodanobacteraceae bacterium]